MPSPSTALRRHVGTTTEIDGVPVFFGSAPGPLRAALMFRVGQADEHLAIRGITHLVEHLALAGTRSRPHAVNGLSGNVFTTFVATGDERTVAGHLRSVCERLSNLPVDPLEQERAVVRAEAAQHMRPAAFRSLAVHRWGAHDHGLCGWDEVGVAGLSAAQVSEWAECGFTHGNAVLCLSGPPPAGLRLPLGAPVFDFDLPSIGDPADDPLCYTDSDRYVALSYLAPHGPAARALAWVVSKRLTYRLRQDLGASSGAQSFVDRLDADRSLYTFVADCVPDHAAAVQAATMDVLLRLLSEPISGSELGDVRRLQPDPDEAYVDPHLLYAAQQHLLGASGRPSPDNAGTLRQVSPQQIAVAAREALSTLLLAVPDTSGVPVTLAAPLRTSPAERLSGLVHLPSATHPTPQTSGLVRSLRGLSLVLGDDAVTVTYDKVVAVLCYDDGTRTLVDETGRMLTVDPRAWQDAHLVFDDIDTAIHPSRRIPAGPRPAPATASAPAGRTEVRSPRRSRRKRRGRVGRVVRRALLLPVQVAAVVLIARLISMAADPSRRASHAVAIVGVPVLTAVLAATVRRTRRPLLVAAAVLLGVLPTVAVATTLGTATSSAATSSALPAHPMGKPAPAAPKAAAAKPFVLDWRDAGFVADFPSRPNESQDKVTTDGVTVTVHEAMWSSGSRTLDVGATKMPLGLQVTGQAVPQAACTNSVSTAHGANVTARWVSGGTHPVRETWFTVAGQRTVMRCFVSGQRLYTIAGTPAEYQAAVQSFRALP